MAWIYLKDSTSSAESEESVSPSMNGSNLSHIAKSNPIVKASYCRECKKGICPKHQFGMIYEHYPKEISVKLSTLSSAASHEHAKTSVLQDMERDWQESEADFFSRSCAWPKKSSPSSYSLKTFQPLQQEGDFKSLMKLPRWGMIVDGILYPLHLLEHCTDAIDGSYWLTPRVKMMATPSASQSSKPIREPSPSRKKKEHGEDLQDSIGRLNPEIIGKKLCPRWVSVLMGYPTNWTDLRHLEIQ